MLGCAAGFGFLPATVMAAMTAMAATVPAPTTVENRNRATVNCATAANPNRRPATGNRAANSQQTAPSQIRADQLTEAVENQRAHAGLEARAVGVAQDHYAAQLPAARQRHERA